MKASHENAATPSEQTNAADAGARIDRLFPRLPDYPPRSMTKTKHRRSRAASTAFLTATFGLLTGLSCLRQVKAQIKKDPRAAAAEERYRGAKRRQLEKEWSSRKGELPPHENLDIDSLDDAINNGATYIPTEGGPDIFLRDVGYYARRVGLDCETFLVQTADGFILELWHLFNPHVSSGHGEAERAVREPGFGSPQEKEWPAQRGAYPVLMMHGLLQSSGAFCCSDEHSLAFFLAKSGFDVWLGNNRCGFEPRHVSLEASDPRMWSWTVKEMAMFDLPALVDRVLQVTGFEKLALVGHSQGTTQTLIALSKDFVPELGNRISVACLLAPAAYSGPLLENPRWFFRMMGAMSPPVWRFCFGKHAFIQPMIRVMGLLPSRHLGTIGYPLFSYLFKWSDKSWDRELRNRAFLWSPVYVSSEHMRWWVGKNGFAKQRCMLNTRVEAEQEAEDDEVIMQYQKTMQYREERSESDTDRYEEAMQRIASNPWFDTRVPPLAMWIAGSDELVDGKRLQRRFELGREPCANVIHSKLIENYEHLDVVWGFDVIEQVGKELVEIIWETIDEGTRQRCAKPTPSSL